MRNKIRTRIPQLLKHLESACSGRTALVVLLWFGLIGVGSAQQSITLDSIGFANLPGDSIEIQLTCWVWPVACPNNDLISIRIMRRA